MQITDKLLTSGETHGRPGNKINPIGVVIHYVGNPGSTASENRDYFEGGSGGNCVSAHYIVGLDGEIIRCIPENEKANHAGKSYDKKYDTTAPLNNSRYIGIENCHPDTSGKFNTKTYQALVELTTDICKRYKLNPPNDVYRHFDVSGKTCPLYYVNNESEWTSFLTAVNMSMGSSQPNPVPSLALYRVRKSAADAASQIGAYSVLDNAKKAADVNYGYKVFDMNGTLIYEPNSIGILQKIVHAEACGEDEKGMILVANVIMNRVNDKSFPNTVKDVVFQKGQFTPVAEGTYDKVNPSEKVKTAIEKSFTIDYSKGALYFRTIKGATPDCWHEKSLVKLFDHGNHRFYK